MFGLGRALTCCYRRWNEFYLTSAVLLEPNAVQPFEVKLRFSKGWPQSGFLLICLAKKKDLLKSPVGSFRWDCSFEELKRIARPPLSVLLGALERIMKTVLKAMPNLLFFQIKAPLSVQQQQNFAVCCPKEIRECKLTLVDTNLLLLGRDFFSASLDIFLQLLC